MQLPHLPQDLKENRGPPRLQQSFFQFSQHALSRQGVHRHRGAEFHRLRCHTEAETCGKLRRPENSQRVLPEGDGVDVPDAAPFEVVPTAIEIQDLAGEHVLHQGVDCKIPA